MKSMKEFRKTQGRIVAATEKYYKLLVNGGEYITISRCVMHKMVVFPPSMMDGDSLKIDTDIDIMRVTENGNTYYYPDHGVYELKEENDIGSKKLLEGLEELSINTDNYLEKLSEQLPEMQSEKRMRALKLLKKCDDAQSRNNLIRLLGGLPSLPDEGESIEYKSSLSHCACGSKFEKEKNGQLMEITMSAAAIANTARKGVVYVGIKDRQKNYEAAGIEEEISSHYPKMSLDLYTNTVIANFFRTYTQSDAFLQGLKFNWLKYQNHLILKIDIDFKGDLVLCNSSNCPYIPYRVGSSTHCVHGYGIVEYIRNHQDKIKTTNN